MKAWRFIALMVLSILLLATFACCPGETLPPGVTIEGIVADAIAADAVLNTCQFDMDMLVEMQVTMEGETSELTMTADAEGAIDEPGKKMYLDMDMIMTMAGEQDLEMSMEMYLVEDWMYMKVEVPGEPSMWTKSPVETGDWEAQDIASQQIDWLFDAEVKFLRTETVDGTECYVMEVTPDLEKLWALMQSTEAVEELPPGQDLGELITDFSVRQWIAKDICFTLKTSVNLTMLLPPEYFGIPSWLVNDFYATQHVVITITMHDINVPVTIELPPEAEEAEDVWSEAAYNADAENIQTAVLAYFAENSTWPLVNEGVAQIVVDGNTYEIIDLCALVGLDLYLIQLPSSAYGGPGTDDDNCDGTTGCTCTGSYVWAIDTSAGGVVYSSCEGSGCAASDTDGFQGVYP